MRIKIEKIVYPGKALGRGEDGVAMFLDGALPGEVVEVDIIKKKKTFQTGQLVRILESAPERITPRCPNFGPCGGCYFQHTGYENQLKIKEAYVQELLLPLAPGDLLPIIASPEPWYYRNKMEFSFYEQAQQLCLGLHQRGQFDQYVPVPPCFITDEDFLPLVKELTNFARKSGLGVYDKRNHTGFYRHLVLRKGKRTGEILMNMVTNQQTGITSEFFNPLIQAIGGKVTSLYWSIHSKPADAVAADELVLLHGTKEIREEMRMKDKTYSWVISPFSFFQTNTLGAEKLYEAVWDYLEPAATDQVLDLYCGTGTLGLIVAPYVEQVWGIEQVPDAVLNAEKNKASNGIENIAFAVASVEKWLRSSPLPPFNKIILDPPRSGLSNKVLEFIHLQQPEKVVYVSCNPATLARDLEYLTRTSGYTFQKAVPIDMFPQTYHVEVVAELIKSR